LNRIFTELEEQADWEELEERQLSWTDSRKRVFFWI